MLALASQVVHQLINHKLFTLVRYFIPGLFALMMLEGHAWAADAPPIPNIDVVTGPAMLLGGVLAGGAWYLKRRYPRLRTTDKDTIFILLTVVLTGCSEAIMRRGISLNVLYAATGQAMLTFFALKNADTTKTDDKKDKS